MTIPTNLIERALNLCGYTLQDMEMAEAPYGYEFSIEKFCFYLLSPFFIEKYTYENRKELRGYITDRQLAQVENFGLAIYEYQRKDEEFPDGNPGPIISLLKKIPGQQKLT